MSLQYSRCFRSTGNLAAGNTVSDKTLSIHTTEIPSVTDKYKLLHVVLILNFPQRIIILVYLMPKPLRKEIFNLVVYNAREFFLSKIHNPYYTLIHV